MKKSVSENVPPKSKQTHWARPLWGLPGGHGSPAVSANDDLTPVYSSEPGVCAWMPMWVSEGNPAEACKASWFLSSSTQQSTTSSTNHSGTDVAGRCLIRLQEVYFACFRIPSRREWKRAGDPEVTVTTFQGWRKQEVSFLLLNVLPWWLWTKTLQATPSFYSC